MSMSDAMTQSSDHGAARPGCSWCYGTGVRQPPPGPFMGGCAGPQACGCTSPDAAWRDEEGDDE